MHYIELEFGYHVTSVLDTCYPYPGASFTCKLDEDLIVPEIPLNYCTHLVKHCGHATTVLYSN